MMRTLLLILFTMITTSVWAQGVLMGKLVQEQKQPLEGANVMLLSNDTLGQPPYQKMTVTNERGFFRFQEVPEGNYQLLMTYMGYQRLQMSIMVKKGFNNAKVLEMVPDEKTLDVVVVEDQSATTIQGDTVQFKASSFQTNPDASAEDLIRKMPGIAVDQEGVKAEGETVRKVLVDGKPFFGDDPSIALKNLPAEIIDKIQVFDKLSEQSEFTGVDDGNTTKTINIITKSEVKQSQFGNLYGGYGTDSRYKAGGTINIFNGEQRISIIGMSNNVSMQNFATEDIMGVVGTSSRRRGRGRGAGGPRGGASENFMIGQQEGIATTHAFGVNYNDQWGEKTEVSGSYFFNMTETNSDQQLFRTYLNDSGQRYEEDNLLQSTNANHRLSMRIDHKFNEKTSLLIRPRVSLQQYNAVDNLTGTNFLEENNIMLNSIVNENMKDRLGVQLNNDMLLRHRFEKRGRTISLNLSTAANNQEGEESIYAEQLLERTQEMITTQQQVLQTNGGYTLSGDLVYTEPVSKNSSLMFRYQSSYAHNTSERETYDLLEESEVLDSLYSNYFDNDYLTHKGGIAFNYRKRGENRKFSMLMLGVDYQRASLLSEQTYPLIDANEYQFDNLLPHARWMIREGRNSMLMLSYRTRTNAPSITQLQNVVDNSNPQQLSSGNANLEQAYSHSLNFRYRNSQLGQGQSLFGFVNVTLDQNHIGSSTVIAEEDMLIEGVALPAGGTYTQPINVEGYFNARALLNYGVATEWIKSNINLTTGASYTHSPGVINDEINEVNTKAMNYGVVVASNISPMVDFTLSTTGEYSIAKNTLQPVLDNNYYKQTTGGSLNYIFGKGFVFRTDLNHIWYTGLSDELNQNFLIWNASLGKKLFKDQRGELRLEVFDLLNQNQALSRTISDAYLEDTRTNVLTQYFMLTFRYKLSHIKTGI
ncbi:TonB-dependent receptor [Algivirga pacifica]